MRFHSENNATTKISNVLIVDCCFGAVGFGAVAVASDSDGMNNWQPKRPLTANERKYARIGIRVCSRSFAVEFFFTAKQRLRPDSEFLLAGFGLKLYGMIEKFRRVKREDRGDENRMKRLGGFLRSERLLEEKFPE